MPEVYANVIISMPSGPFTAVNTFEAVSGGRVYIGKTDTDPVRPENQIQVYLEQAQGELIPVLQPLMLNAGGYLTYEGEPAKFVTEKNYSMTVIDCHNVLQFHYPNIFKYEPDQFKQQLSYPDGLKYIGRCADIGALRNIEPTEQHQLIDVVEYFTGCKFGGGYFIYDNADKNSADNGGSIIVTAGGCRWKRRETQLLPVHFGAVPDGKTDVTDSMRRYIAASEKRTVDFRNGLWRISATLDLTNVAAIIADGSCAFKVNPTGFSGEWAMTIGNPATGDYAGRVAKFVIQGVLTIDCDSRAAPLNGLYMKGNWFAVDHIRITNFNGCGLNQTAVWDSTFQRLSIELCGNAEKYACILSNNGDTHNTTHIVALQVEQAYDKALSITAIRNVIDNIHCERTYITTLNDGNTNLPSGLKYTTCDFNIGNSVINQTIINAYPENYAPDGSPCVSDCPSIALSLDYSEARNISAAGAVLCCLFGHQVIYSTVVARDFYIVDPSQKITIDTPRIVGTLVVGSEVVINNGIIGTFTPRHNARNVIVSGGEINKIEFTSPIRGQITFNNVTVMEEIGDLKSPPGGNINGIIGAEFPPTTFNNCQLERVVGAWNSRAIFNGGKIKNVTLNSQSAFEFYNVSIGTFSYSGNTAFITRGVKADNVLRWSEPRHFLYPAGTITERIGPATNCGVIYVCRSNTEVSWTPIVSV
ncbi:hypothetical protein JK232_12950 [Nissabacter archeti]|uniref:Bacteriophage P22 tailspike N-terminal domain-containing protein n=1 Tax=Nissabacter archeti TaxID=1917880 RepID=A0ABS5JIQ6_9GAMM|nr:phage tailspike protein [Nissabacter archeti]MBS0969804.1 hypothetical protein [Nissabacter archeti]